MLQSIASLTQVAYQGTYSRKNITVKKCQLSKLMPETLDVEQISNC